MIFQGYQTGINNLDELIRAFNFLQNDLKKLLNNGLQLDDNMNFAKITHTFVAADTAEEISHGLGKTPVGRIIVHQDKSASIYIDDLDDWTNAVIELKCSVLGTYIEGYVF